jgi:hypothetical protein
MDWDIDVSGEDLLSKNYTICIADKDSTIRGFKFDEEIVNLYKQAVDKIQRKISP